MRERDLIIRAPYMSRQIETRPNQLILIFVQLKQTSLDSFPDRGGEVNRAGDPGLISHKNSVKSNSFRQTTCED